MKLLSIKTKGTLTIEAAFVLPIFLYAIIAFLYFFHIMAIYEEVQYAITETGLHTAKYAYVYDYIMHDENAEDDLVAEEENLEKKLIISPEVILTRGINSSYIKIKMKEYLNETYLNQSCIKGGYEGIETFLSTYLEDEEHVDIIACYQVKIPLLFFDLDKIWMVQRVRLRGWNGAKPVEKSEDVQGEEDSQVVYITEHGTVYHMTKECTHLKLSIQEVYFDLIDNYRNQAGGKYTKCNICYDSNIEKAMVYITRAGDHYHSFLSCSGLKRNIIPIKIEDIEDKNPCKRCGN